MPEMRHDPIQRRWVVISPERGGRPTDYGEQHDVADGFDPFAEGSEDQTPPEILAVRPSGGKPNTPGWRVRVVPNKYPAFRVEGDLDRRAEGLYDAMNGVGAHEAVVETPDRDTNFSLLEPDHAFDVVRVVQSRITDLMKDKRLKYVIFFRNHGRNAGASLSHPHSQIIATAVTPRGVAIKLDSAHDHYQRKERCLFCDVLAQEQTQRQRIILETEHFVAFAPYASRFPYEIMVLPRRHQHDFRLATEDVLRDFAATLQQLLQRLNTALDDPPYNLVLHTSPNTASRTPRSGYWETLEYDWHWHVEILPRMSSIAGFEFGTGLFMNSVLPERAADVLRSVNL